MAQLKDTIVSGNLRVTDTTLTDTLQVTTIKAPTSSGGTTYGPGTSGQVLKSNGTTTYWASDSNSDVNVTQTATTTDAAYEILFSGTADNTTRTETARKNSNLKFNPSTGSLYASFIYAGGSESQSAYPSGGYHVYDCRDIGVTPANGDKTANFYFHMTGTPDTSKWWSVMHVKGWTGAYSAWEIAGPAHNSDQRTTPLYVRTSNASTAWGSWRKIYDTSNPPTASEVGALSTSTKYAGSASVGGPASLLAYGHTNEINISGGKQSTCYFNYRDADTDAQDEGETPVSINYKFCNYRNSTANTTITAANFAGNATSANTLTLKSLAFGSTLNTTTGLFAYTTTGSIYGTNAADWTGIQIGSSADRFQIMGSAGSTVLIRTNDNSDGNISTGWSKWAALMTPASVVAGSGLTKTYGYFDGTADSDIIINATIGHSNSVTAQSTTVFKKFSYDACGHITGVADVSASDLPSHTHNYIPNTKAGVNAAINLLDTGSSTPVDGDYYISQYVNGGTTTTTYHRRPMSALASYVRTKLSVTSSGSGPVVTGMSYSSSTGVLTYTKGRVLSTAGGQWISGRDNAPVLANSSSSTANGFYPMGAVKTNTGAWSIGALGNGDSFAFSFSTDTNYSGGVNTTNNYYIGTDGAFTGTAAGLTTKAITASTVDTTPGSFVFGGTNIIGGINDWVGFQADAGNDRFQIIANSQLVFRQNDSTTIEGNWDPWLGCITPNNVSGDSGITITKITTTIGTGTTALTYDSGVKISHTNSITAQTSEVFKKFKYDAQGHITGVSAVAAADITALGIPAQDTTYSAGNHLSLSSTTFSLASYCKTITDWNDAKTTGWYMGASVTNAPSTAWWMGRVTAHNAKYCIQEVWQFTASTDGHKVPHKMRMYVNEVWGNWVDITVGTAVPENAVFTDTKYGISGAYGSGNKTWVTTLTASGTGTTSTVPTASTSVYGITKLYNGVDSTSTELAATANAVKTAYDKGNHSHPYLSNTTKYALSSSVGGPALTQLTESLSDTTSSHATVLQTYFTNNVSTVTRNQQLAFYSRAYSNGSMYMGYFLSSYDENPYGGFFVAHYNDPYYVGIKGGTFTQYPLLTQRTLTPETMDTVTGTFAFDGTNLLGGVYDWAGLQVDAGNDAFQMTINSTQLIIRQNDTSTKTTENWGSWRGCLTPANVSGSGGITVTENDTTIGSGASALTYKGSVTISHSNSITAQTSTVFKKFSYDANGHITGVDTVEGTDLPAHTHTHSKGGTWIKARDNPNIYVNPPTNSGSYYPAIFAKTKDGGWSMGVLGGSDTGNVLYVTYTTDANYNADNNTNTYQISFPKDGGTLALTKNHVAKSGDTMTGLLTMYREGTTAQDYPAGFKFSVKDTTTGKTYSDAYIYAYQDHAANSYGTNMVINPGGCIFIGAGESADAHYSAIKSNLATSEYMYLTADAGIYIQGNGGTIANRKGLYIDTGQNIVPSVADTLTDNVGSIGTSDYRWGNVYATQLNGKLGQYISTGRPTSANLTTVGDRTVQLIQATSSMTTAKPSTDGYILNFDWDNAGNYQSQLFLANSVGLDHIQFRTQGGSATWENSKWVTLLSERNSPAFNRIFDRYYRTPASTGWVRILTIGSFNNNGRVYGMSRITVTRTYSNNAPEVVSFEVIHNYNTSPNIYFSKSLQQTSSTKVFTNIRIVKSSDGKEQYVDIYHNVSTQNYISIRYEIFEPYDMLDVNNSFPVTTPSDGTTLSVLSTSPASADIMRASVAIPSQYDNNFIYANSCWGFAHRDGTTTAYMRTTSNGLLPYQSGNVGSGHSNLGTSSWYFSNIYVDTVNTQQVKIKGTGTYDGTISNANATADRTVILPDSSGVIALMNVILDDAQGVTEWDFSLDANLYRSFIIEVIMPGYTTQTVTVVAHKYYPTAPSSFTMHSSKATSASSYNILPAWIGLCYNTVDTSTPTWQFSVGRASKAISLGSGGGISSVSVPNTDVIKMVKIIGLTN